MRMIATLALATTIATGTAHADSFRQQSDLGLIIASETQCDLSLSQDAIAAWIDTNVPADDMTFAGGLNTSISVHRRQIDRMEGSEITAHCHAVRRTAQHHELLE